MLPTGHLEFTWAGLHLLQSRAGKFCETDYRWIALAALAPDIVDKPLALTVYRDTHAALFWGHNLWFHLLVWATALAWAAWPRASTSPRPDQDAARGARSPHPAGSRMRFVRALPYLVAFSAHLIADRMWGFQESLLYPLGAGYWHPWVDVGAPGAMLAAYVEIIRTTPILIVFEVVGLALLAWVVWERRRKWRTNSCA